MADLSFLTEKYGPLPGWAYVVVGGVGLFLLAKLTSKQPNTVITQDSGPQMPVVDQQAQPLNIIINDRGMGNSAPDAPSMPAPAPAAPCSRSMSTDQAYATIIARECSLQGTCDNVFQHNAPWDAISKRAASGDYSARKSLADQWISVVNPRWRGMTVNEVACALTE